MAVGQGVSLKGHLDIILGRRLRHLRRQAKVTQQQLADPMTAVGHRMNHSAISSAESGERRVTTGEAVRLAAAVRAGPW
jgi:hypothetical protein